MTTLLDELTWRGLVHDVTPGLADRLATGPVTGYVGFDPTATSLQIGNLVVVMLLAHLQRAGGSPIILVGGGTGMIGDPSGKRTERPLLTVDQIDENVHRQRQQLERFLDFTGSNAAVVVNNADWLRTVRFVDFLRDVGKHFTLSYMLQKDSVKSRLEAGISYTEFSYMLLQAFDFLHLHRTRGCELQMGGSDQWGNITAGTELIRRVEGAPAHGLCAPLMTTATGAKFGKSEAGSVWLDPAQTSPYKFYQFWINQDDQDIEAYLGVFTFEEQPAIAAIMTAHQDNPGARDAQRKLADDLTGRVHGDDALRAVQSASRILFGQLDAAAAPANVWTTLAGELPVARIGGDALPASVIDLVTASGLTTSKGEARRQLRQGGISLNGVRVAEDATVSSADLLAGGHIWMRRGKKTDVIVVVERV